MGVNVGGFPVSAFVALILLFVLIGATAYARRRGQRMSRPALIIIAIVIALLVVWGMAGGLLIGR